MPNFEKAASDDGFDPLTGEALVAQHMFYGVKPADSTVTRPSSEGFFGIMDRDTAAQWGLPMAQLVNHAGDAVGPDDASVMAGYKDMTTLNGVKVPNFASTDPAAYPLTKIDYTMVRQKITKTDLDTGAQTPDPTKVRSLKTFLDWESTTGQQHLLEGYLPLPAAEVAQTKKVASEITVGNRPGVHHNHDRRDDSGDDQRLLLEQRPRRQRFCRRNGRHDAAGQHSDPKHDDAGAEGAEGPARRRSGTELVAGRSGGRLDHTEPTVVRAGVRHRGARARLAWYASPKVMSPRAARTAARNGDGSNGVGS